MHGLLLALALASAPPAAPQEEAQVVNFLRVTLCGHGYAKLSWRGFRFRDARYPNTHLDNEGRNDELMYRPPGETECERLDGGRMARQPLRYTTWNGRVFEAVLNRDRQTFTVRQIQ